MTTWLLLGCLLAAEPGLPAPGPAALARLVDERLAELHHAAGIVPTERTDDAEFLRRVTLDLIGRIPTVSEVRAFLDDSSADKRRRKVDSLLQDPQHAKHFAHVWRALLLPEAETEPQLRYFQPGLEAWLQQHRADNSGFDAIVRELLTVPIAGPDETPEFVLRDLSRPNPIAFIAAKSAEPAKIASSSVRLFLGLRLECAQCHNHPFDHWSQRQFWNQAAFFAGIERRGRGAFAPLVEVNRSTIPLMDSAELVPALYLDETEPRIGDAMSSRDLFAEWMTSTSNPYFARAVVNRVWSQFMGLGLVDPVDDFRDADSSAHTRLLEELALAFKESGFDLTMLMKAICLTEAYQRTSQQTHASQVELEQFARMAIKPMSADQFFDSLAQSIAYEPKVTQDGNEDPLRRRVMDIFVSDGSSSDPETSVAQALALMNGSVVDRATKSETSSRLKQVVADFPDSPQQQIEQLYLATFSRFPTPEERTTLREFYEADTQTDHPRLLEDVFWMLLNSAEFRWNH